MIVKRNDETVSGECEPYQLDLTDYVTGDMTFLTKEKQEQLFDHLRQCAKCRQDFFDWDETFGVLVTKQHHAKAEVKKRMDDLIEQFKSPAPAKPPSTDVKLEIDTAAERIHTWVKENGKTVLPVLREKTGLLDYPFYEAMGVLITGEKIIVDKGEDNRPSYVSPR